MKLISLLYCSITASTNVNAFVISPLATRGLNSFELNAKNPSKTEDVAKKSFSFFGTKAENTNNKKNVSKLKKSNVQSKITPKKKVSAGKKAVTKKKEIPKKKPLSKPNVSLNKVNKKNSSKKVSSVSNEKKNSLPKVQIPDIGLPNPIQLAGTGMQALKPLFALEAKIQANALFVLADLIGAPFRVYADEVRKDLKRITKGKRPVLYTYGLSPFSVEAKRLLEPYDVEIIELGPEWFLLGPKESQIRVALSEISNVAQTSLPHLFVKGESLGGVSSGGRDDEGIVGLEKSGQLSKLLNKRSRK